jgi:hypothetical protein
MPVITQSSSSLSSDSVGDSSPGAATARTLRMRSYDGSSLLPPGQRDDFNSNDEMEESTKSTPRRSNKSIRAVRSSEEATEMTLVSNKRRKISDASSHRRESASANNISHPGPNDVMLGRGGESNAHIGNKKYRYIIENLKLKYSHASRGEKSAISRAIVALWRNLDPPGRFLLKQKGRENDTNGQIVPSWYDVDDDIARTKTSQAISDADNPSAADYIKLFGKKEAELLQVCIEYLKEKTPGIGEVVDPLVLLNQTRSGKMMKQELSSPIVLQPFRLGSTATLSYPTQSVRVRDTHKTTLQDMSSKKRSRQAWSATEDCQLQRLVEGFTSLNQRIRWVKVSNEMPGRSGKQCRGEEMTRILLYFVLDILLNLVINELSAIRHRTLGATITAWAEERRVYTRRRCSARSVG